jgi:phage shock protein A
MSIFSKAVDILQGKTNHLLNTLEDPNETLDLSYDKMVSALQESKRQLADVVAERISLDTQIATVTASITKADDNAKKAIQAGKDDLARQVLELKKQDTTKQTALQTTRDTLFANETKITDYCNKLQQRIESFKTQKEVLKAQTTAAAAQSHVMESLTGIDRSMGDVGDALQRAQDNASHAQAKASALESMLDSGTLQDPLDSRSSVDKQIDALNTTSTVDDELAKLKAEMSNS